VPNVAVCEADANVPGHSPILVPSCARRTGRYNSCRLGQCGGNVTRPASGVIGLVPRAAIALIALACIAGGMASAIPGYGARLSDSDGTKPRLTLRIKGQGVVFVGAVRLRCFSQAASNVVLHGHSRFQPKTDRHGAGGSRGQDGGSSGGRERAAERVGLASSASSISPHSRQPSTAPKQGPHD
jgi:hypothetical protein